MIRFKIIILSILLITVTADAQNVNKGLRKLNREQYVPAKVIFDKVLKTEETAEHPAALYGLGAIFASTDYRAHDIFKALKFSSRAIQTHKNLTAEQKEDAEDVVTEKEMKKQLKTIDDQYTKSLQEQKDLKAVKEYLNTIPTSSGRKEMIIFRNKLAWEQAKEYNSLSAYQDYIENYPESEFSEKARSAIIRKKYEKAKAEEDVSALRNFVEQYPDSKYKDKAMGLIEKLEYKRAKNLNSIEYYERFIKNFPSSDKLDEIKALRNKKAFEMVKFLDKVKEYEKFIKNYPKAKQVEKARKMRNKLAYQKAMDKNSPDAYQEFINNYPEAKQVSKLKEKLKEMNVSPQLIDLQEKQKEIAEQNLQMVKIYSDVEKENLIKKKQFGKYGRKTLIKTFEDDNEKTIKLKYKGTKRGYPSEKTFFKNGNKQNTITLKTDENGNLLKKIVHCTQSTVECKNYTRKISYDNKKHRAQSMKISGGDTLTISEIRTNSSGQIEKKIHHKYTPTDIVKTIETFSRNSQNRLVEESLKDEEKQIIYVVKYNYNDDKLKTKETYDETGKRKKVFQYDNKDNRTSATVYSLPSKEIISEKYYEYKFY